MNKATPAVIHPSAEVAAEAEIGDGTIIWHQAQVRERSVIGSNCILAKDVYVDFGVQIGNNCKLQNGVYVYHPAVLEDGVFLGPGVILTNDRSPRAVNPDMSLKDAADWLAVTIRIRRGAAIGAGSVVLPGVIVGTWAMVGAGSVVTRDVPDYGLAFGNPARLRGFVCPCGGRLARESGESAVCLECERFITLAEADNDSSR